MAFIFFMAFVIVLRIAELIVARSNEKWVLQHGAVEYGRKHYPFMVSMHVLFLIALIVEYCVTNPVAYSTILIGLYLLLIALKVWVIASLGKFWNTRIYRAPNFPLVKKGPYKFVKHPNYIIVVLEILVIPLAFNLYYTAIIFSLLNGLMLYVRVREENKALNV